MTGKEKMEEEEGKIKLTGTLSIYEVADVHENLLGIFEGDKPVEIDLGEITYCDTAGIQLLISAKKTVEKKGNPFIISSISRAVREAAEDAGTELDGVETVSGG